MRKVFDLIILLIFLSILFWQKDKIISSYNFLLASPCDRPLTYRIGELDKGYKLTNEQFLKSINEGSQIWDKTVNKELFTYNPQGKIVINLIYSDRQSMVDQIDTLENNLKTGKLTLNASLAEYKNLQADFESKLRAFNAEVENWNKQGGAPKDVFNQLKTQQAQLQTEADQLNQMAAKLNLSAQNYNLGVSKYNQSLKSFQQALNETPEAGIYDGSVPKIDIYLTTGKNELIHTIAHEMGHVLGLSHLDDPQAIMYPYSSEVISPDNQEISELIAYCGQKNLNLIITRFKEKFNRL